MAPGPLQINLQCLCEPFTKKTGYSVYYTVQLLKQKPQPKIIILEVSLTDYMLMTLAAYIAVIQWATTTVCSVIWSSL